MIFREQLYECMRWLTEFLPTEMKRVGTDSKTSEVLITDMAVVKAIKGNIK